MVKDKNTGHAPRVFSVALVAWFGVNFGYEKIYADFCGFVVCMYFSDQASGLCFPA